MGSKSKITPQIVEYILARHPNIKVYSNDYDITLISLYKDLQDENKRKELLDNYAYRFITKKEFDEINKNIPIYISEYTQYEGLEVVWYETKRQNIQGGSGKLKKELLMYNDCKDYNKTLGDLLWNKE